MLLHSMDRFVPFSASHIAVLALVPAVWVAALLYLRNRTNDTTNMRVRILLGSLLLGQYLAWLGWEIIGGEFSLELSLPLNLCDFSMLLCFILLYTENKRLFEVLYFLALAGSLQSFVTPNIVHGFPHLEFFVFYLQHGGEIFVVLYYALIRKFRPYPRSIPVTILSLMGFMALVYGINMAVGANYNFLMHDTPNPSMVTRMIGLFGAPPRHIIGLALISVVSVLVLYIPYFIRDTRVGLRKSR